MSARSAKVSSLSDKIQGLKFMQRATASTAANNGRKADEEEVRNGRESVQQADPIETFRELTHTNEHGESEETGEKWTLTAPRVVPSSTEKRAGDRIVAEPGWNRWLGQLLDQNGGKEDVAEQSKEARMVFGAWAEAKRKRKTRSEDVDGDVSDDFSGSPETESDDEHVSDGTKVPERRFIKPGTLTSSRSMAEGKQTAEKARKTAKDGAQKGGETIYGSLRKTESTKKQPKRRKR